jgi:hypothetical protein
MTITKCPERNLRLTEEQFRAEHSSRRGLIPIELDAFQRTALWLDLNNYHCHDGSFRRSLVTYAALRAGASTPSEPWRCVSSLDFLRSAPHATDCLGPTGFIFHAGRCGSTLLAKVIARSEQHMVFGEGGPHNDIWPVIAAGCDPPAMLFRNLLLHTGRPRLQSYRAHIVKFTSFTIAQFEIVRTAFPKVPALFLFRHPAGMLASYRRAMPGWMGRDTGIGTIWHSAERAIADFFQYALTAGESLKCLDYEDLTPQKLPAILDFFQLDPPAGDLELMRGEFRWDAKSNHLRSSCPTASIHSETPPELLALYSELSSRRIRF